MRHFLFKAGSSRRAWLLSLVALAAAMQPATAADIAGLWNGSVGNWTDATRWSTTPVYPNNSSPSFYDATINAGAVTLNQAITINALTLGGGTLDGAASLIALEGLTWTGGTISGAGQLMLGTAGPTTITGGAAPLVLSARTVQFSGTTDFTAGTIRGGFGATLLNSSGATFTVQNDAAFFANAASPLYTFQNAGTFVARSTSGAGFTSMDARFDNTGTLRVERTGTASAHTLSLAGGGTHSGTVQLAAGTSVELGGATTLVSGAAFTGAGTAVVAGNVALTGNVTAQNIAVAVGELNVGANTLSAGLSGTQTGGTTRIGTGGTLRVATGSRTWLLDGGTMTGTGTLDARLSAQGDIAPGAPLGMLAVTGDAAFGSDARLQIQIGGTSAGQFDALAVAGPVTLDGQLRLSLTNGFFPAFAQTFTIMTGASVTGAFVNAPLDGSRFPIADGLGSFLIDYTPNAVVVTGFIPEPGTGSLLAVGAGLFAAARRRRR